MSLNKWSRLGLKRSSTPSKDGASLAAYAPSTLAIGSLAHAPEAIFSRADWLTFK